MKDLHWLPVTFRIKYKLCLLMHLINIHQCPDYLQDVVSLTSAVATRPGFRSSDGLSYQKPATRTKFGEHAFSHAGPAEWNDLPDSLQDTLNSSNEISKLFCSILPIVLTDTAGLFASVSVYDVV